MEQRFLTTRLTVYEFTENSSEHERRALTARVPGLFTAEATRHLPANFQGIDSIEKADRWISKMVSECRIFVATPGSSISIIGLVFVHVTAKGIANIGYLLAPEEWGRGLATELLTGLLQFAKNETDWTTLLAGVGVENTTSSQLLIKLGFSETPGSGTTVRHFEYRFR